MTRRLFTRKMGLFKLFPGHESSPPPLTCPGGKGGHAVTLTVSKLLQVAAGQMLAKGFLDLRNREGERRKEGERLLNRGGHGGQEVRGGRGVMKARDE